MSAAVDLRSKKEKDAELDKRIEALRKKNEALLRRYQEIEEDRKKAEQEGIAVTTPHRARPGDAKPEGRRADEDLSGTVQEKRAAKEKKPSGPPKPGAASRGLGRSPLPAAGRGARAEPPADPFGEGVGDAAPGERGGRGRRSRGRGLPSRGTEGDAGPDRRSKEWEERRRQNIRKMNEEMEKIAEYERNQRDGLHEKNPVRNFLDDPRRSGSFQEADRREGSRRHVRNWGGADFDKVKAGMEREKTWQGPGRRSGPKAGGALDMTLSMTGRERAEYIRWKKEREQIDEERLARHRKPTGQWRREWDAEKSDAMFRDGSAAAPDREEGKRPPPKPPTLGEFLAPHPARWGRKSAGRGAGGRPYSMHDNRWEEKEQAAPGEGAETQQADEAPSGGARAEPSPSLSPEEDEDQWEDFSEEGEDGSPAAASEDEAPRGGCGPVSDWGEEMDVSSPRSSLGDGPLPGPAVPRAREASGETSGLSPLEPSGPPRWAQDPPPREEARPKAQREPSEKRREAEDGLRGGAAAVPRQLPAESAPGTVEITDFQRVRFLKR